MAGVFDGSNKVPRRVKDPNTDDTLPGCGSLNWDSITSNSGLAGTTGADCMLVSGDRWQQMSGNLTENYGGNKTIKVQGSHTETIQSDRSITVTAGSVTHNVSAGQVTDQIAMSHQETVGVSYQLSAPEIDIEGSATVTINGAMVMINS